MTFEGYLNHIKINIEDINTRNLITKAIANGVDDLSNTEKKLLYKGISDYIMEECPYCGDNIEYEDMEISIFNGKCPNCMYKYNKILEE